MQLQTLLNNRRERKLKEMNGLTWSRKRRLNSSRKYQKGYEKAACLTVGSLPGKREAYGMTESGKGLMAVLADGNETQGGKADAVRIITKTFEVLFQRNGIFCAPNHYFQSAWKEAGRGLSKRSEDLQSFSAASLLVRGQKLWYFSTGSFRAAVFRNKRLVVLPTGSKGSFNPLLLNHGDYVILMSPGLYRLVSKADIEGCLDQKGSCEEKALRLVNLSCQDRKIERMGSAVVVIRLK